MQHEASILQKISKHYQTGEPLPSQMIAAITKLEKFNAGMSNLRQLNFGLLALEYFGPGNKKDTNQILEEIQTKICPYIVWDENNHMQASFGHLAGYGAKYYGYMWSKVFAKDLFAHIKQYGLLNPDIGRKYTQMVIGQGGQKDPNLLLEDFLGRKPNKEAFMKDLGFKI